MKASGRLLIPAAAMVLSALAAWGATDGGTATVGDFAFKISRAMGRRPADQAAAVKALRESRVDLGKDVGAGLTWGRAASILRGLGVQVTTPQDPAERVSSARATQIVNTVAQMHDEGHRVASRHSGDDCPPSPSSPDDCHGDDDDHDHGDHDHHGDGDHHGDDDDHGDGHHHDDQHHHR